jgi:hypothetical protein
MNNTYKYAYVMLSRALGKAEGYVLSVSGRKETYKDTWQALDNIMTRGHAIGYVEADGVSGKRAPRVWFEKTAESIVLEGEGVMMKAKAPEPCSFERLCHEAHVACERGKGDVIAEARATTYDAIMQFRATATIARIALTDVVEQTAPYMHPGEALSVVLFVGGKARIYLRFLYVRPGVALVVTNTKYSTRDYAVDGVPW